jgi:hypothetical protein
VTKMRPHTVDRVDLASDIQSWFDLASTDFDDGVGYNAELAAWSRWDGFDNFAPPIGPDKTVRAGESPAEAIPSSPPRVPIGSQGQASDESPAAATGPAVTIANGASVEINCPSAQSVTFAGTTGT